MATLYEEIVQKCTADQIAARDYHSIAATVNVGRTKLIPTIISERGILEKYPDGPIAADTVLTKLEGFANAGLPLSSLVKRALKFLGTGDGLDIGSATTQAMLSQLGGAGIITADEANKLKALAPIVNNHVGWEQCMAAIEENI